MKNKGFLISAIVFVLIVAGFAIYLKNVNDQMTKELQQQKQLERQQENEVQVQLVQLAQLTEAFGKQIASQQSTNDSLRATLDATTKTLVQIQGQLQTAQNEIETQKLNLESLNKDALEKQHKIEVLERLLARQPH